MSLLLVGGASGCCNTTGQTKPQPDAYRQKADEMFDLVWNLYSVPEYGLFSEYYPKDAGVNLDYFDDGIKQAQETSFLWPLSGLTSSAIYLAGIDPDRYMPYLEKSIEALEKYYDTSRVPFGYQAYPVALDHVDRYYDDNGLVGIDYIEAYKITNRPEYLEKAKQILTFILSGWDQRYEGGTAWLEGKRDQKPACANGKAVVLAAKLYEATLDPYYLETTRSIYNWMMKYLLIPQTNIIANSWLCRRDGGVREDKPYTYNTGTVIQAAVSLYNATGEQKYLDEAKMLCQGSADFFFHYTDDGIPYTYNIPWFDVVLFRGYQDYFNATGDRSYADILIKALDYAWDNARDSMGLVCNDWTGRKDEQKKPKWLLDSSCIIEFMARTSEIKNKQ